MPKPTLVRMWDEFWNTTEYLRLHHLGCQGDFPDEQPWLQAVQEMQESGRLTRKQIRCLTALIEETAKLTRARSA